MRSARPDIVSPGVDWDLQNQSPLILCIINGDENVFPKSLLLQGQTGGRQAAQSLTKTIADYLANEDLQVLGRLSFWITVYYDKRSLLELLLDNDVCAAEQFEAFLSGFSETSPRFTMVDVGFSKGATAAKVIGANLVSSPLFDRFETCFLMIVQNTFRLKYATRKLYASSSDVSSGASLSQLAPAHLLLRDPPPPFIRYFQRMVVVLNFPLRSQH